MLPSGIGYDALMFICTNCNHPSLKWSGKCANCNAWNTLVEKADSTPQKTGKLQESGKVREIHSLALGGKEIENHRSPLRSKELTSVL